MGCDIHPWIQWLEFPANAERRTEDHWSEWSGEMHWGRSYAFFARLAGVRCSHPEGEDHGWDEPCPTAIVKPRGWPDKKPWGCMEGEYHTPTWLTLEEFKRASEGVGWPEVAAAIAAMEAFEAAGYKTRIVIAFDN